MEQADIAETLSVDVTDSGGIKIIKCSGYIDSENYLGLTKVFDSLLDSGLYRIVVDLSGVEYISSAGWGIFLGNLRKANSGGGDIRLAGMQESVMEIFDLLNLENLIRTFRTSGEASKFEG
jgi:anti-anti-sigma factor